MAETGLEAIADAIERLRELPLEVADPVQIHADFLNLVQSAKYRPIGITRDCTQHWYRVRQCDEKWGFRNVQDCLYPPAERVGFGRANYPKRPVLYASMNVPTALCEVNARTGQFFQIVVVRPRPPKEVIQLPCFIVGNYAHFMHSGRLLVQSSQLEEQMNKALKRQDLSIQRIRYVDAFIADMYGRSVTANGWQNKLTAAMANVLLWDWPTMVKSGLIYPSVQLYGGANIAISPEAFDEFFEVTETYVVEVVKRFDYGIHFLLDHRYAADFSPDGTIQWNVRAKLQKRMEISKGFAYVDESQVRAWRSPNLVIAKSS